MFIPMTALVAVVNLASARLAGRFGPRVPMVAGQLLGTVGLVALLGVGAHTNVWAVAALMVPVGLGGAIAVAVFGALLVGADTFLAGMRWSMLLAAAGLVVAAGATLTLPRTGRRGAAA